MSQYNRITKKYYAQSYSTNDGKTYNYNGNEQDASDNGTVWEGIILNLATFIEWLLSLFGLNTNSATQTLTAENTLPSQTADGFVVEAGFGEAGAILLALAAGGAILSGGLKTKKNSK